MAKKESNGKKEKVVKKQVEEIHVNLDDIKDELYNYTDEMIRKYYLQEIDKVNKVIIRDKNKKILFRNFIITLLLLVIVYLLYLLTTVNYFGKNNESTVIETDSRSNAKNEADNRYASNDGSFEKKEPTLDELKEEYGYLLDMILINENSLYVKDYYQGNLTNELKNYLALNNIDFKKIDDMDGYNMFSEAIIKDAYLNNFVGSYNSVSFNYNGNLIRYINKLNSFITDDVLNKTNSNIKREITDIKVDDNVVSITTVEGLLKDDKLYNVVTKEEITEYKKDTINNYADKLNTKIYTFENKKLSSIK